MINTILFQYHTEGLLGVLVPLSTSLSFVSCLCHMSVICDIAFTILLLLFDHSYRLVC